MLMRGLASAIAVCLILTGCLGNADEGEPDTAPLRPIAVFGPVAVSDVWPGAEPVIAVASDGTVYIEGVGGAESPPATMAGNVNKVVRSTDDGATWTDITPPAFGQERSNDGFLAVGPDDAVYAANVFSLTLQLYRSDDRGDSWTRLPVPPLPALMHRHWYVPMADGTVHLVVEALPPSFVPFLVGQEPLALPPNPNEALWYTVSRDRGDTWSAPVQIDPVVNFAGQGNLVVSDDGERLYVLRYEEDDRVDRYTYDDGHWYLLRSEDGGASWERLEMFDLDGELSAAVMPLALDPAGTLYFASASVVDGTARTWYRWSEDDGETWSARVLVDDGGPPRLHAMPWLIAPQPATLRFVYYESLVEATGSAVDVDVPWGVTYAEVHNATSDAPEVRREVVAREVQHTGNVCAKGPACEAGEDRTLLDFIWLDEGPDGASHLVWSSTEWERRSAFPVYARVS